MSDTAHAPGVYRLARSLLALAVIASLAGGLSGCGGGGGGGGGGNLRPTPPPTSPPPPPPPSPPPTSPPPTAQPAMDAHLVLSKATAGHRDGYTGAGYRIGIIDSGVNRNHPALSGRVGANLNYLDSRQNNLSVDDVVGHGTTVAQLAAGKPVGSWPGGVAPGATVLSARIIADKRPDDDGSGQGNQVSGAIGVKSIHQDLVGLGMRIMNNSWGGLYWTQPGATAAIADEYRFFIRDHDGLVVFATGNESRADPTDMASLPSKLGTGGSLPAADLEKGWLAVAALDTNQPSQLASYSNACGVARNYCLVAPGTAVFTGHNSTASNLEYYYGSGTSYAAPLVSGAAAVVWEKYPYFNNDLIRQTLLGTATDLGAPGVDAVFGYGLLDVAKALGGPAKFDWGDVAVRVDGSSTWSNAISGNGGLIKRGSGELTIGAGGQRLDYLGDTRVEQGRLNLRGPLTRSNVVVSTGGTLAGAKSLGGNLDNAGRVQIDEGTGGEGLSVAGNYLQRDDAVLSLIVGYGPLKVAGAATLQGGEVYLAGLRSGYVAKVREDVLTTGGGISGRFDALNKHSTLFMDASLVYGSHAVWLDVRRLDVVAAAAGLGSLSPASAGAAQRVEAAFGAIDQHGAGAFQEQGFSALAGQFQAINDQQQAKDSLRSLSGEAHVAATAATFDSLDLGRRALSHRFDQLASTTGVDGAWSQSLSASGTPMAGAQMQAEGWVVGQDVRLGHGLSAGVAFGQSRGDSRSLGLADRSRELQTQAMAYVGGRGEHGYVLGRIGAGQWQRQLDRQVQLGANAYGVHSQYGGEFMLGGVEAGWHLQGQAGALVPYLGAEYAQVRSDGFSETGAAGFGLRSEGSVASRSQAIAGVRAERDWGRVRVGSHVEWQQTLYTQGLDGMQASFVGVEAWSPMAARAPAQSGGVFGLSAQAQLGVRSNLALSWEQRFGPRGDARQVWMRYALGF